MKKNLTLYIQGVNYLSSHVTFFQWFINLCYWFINAKPNYKVEHPDWLKKEHTKSERVEAVEWKSDLNPLSKREAVIELKKAIEKYRKDYNIIVVGTSLGGLIATDALSDFTIDDVSNLILVGSINKHKNISLNGIKILNIYSKKDTLARLATRLLAPIHGSQKLNGANVINVDLGRARHDQLFKDLKIYHGPYKDKTISQIVSLNIN